MPLALDAAPLARARRLGLATRLVAGQRGAQDQHELVMRVVAVLYLVAGRLRGDDQGAVGGQLAREPREQQRAIGLAERRRRPRIPPQLDLARDLVDVLAARPARARDREIRHNLQASLVASTISQRAAPQRKQLKTVPYAVPDFLRFFGGALCASSYTRISVSAVVCTASSYSDVRPMWSPRSAS